MKGAGGQRSESISEVSSLRSILGVHAGVNDSLELDNLSAVAFELGNSQCIDNCHYKLCVGSFALELGAISELNVAGS